MNKKEMHHIKTDNVFKAIKTTPALVVTEDFVDFEGHGYWTGVVRYMGMEFCVDMQRRDFSVIVYEVPGEPFYKVSAEELEEALEEIIEEALAKAEEEINMLLINQGLGLK